MKGDTDRRHRPVLSVVQAIAILDTLGGADSELGVTAISRATGISKTSTYNLLMTLEDARFVVRGDGSANYALGWRLYELGMQAVANLDLARGVRPYLERLSAETGETALAGVLEGDEVLYIERSESEVYALRMVVRAGRRAPLHATATGKVLLTYQGDEFVERMLTGSLKPSTPNTIVDPERLRHELDLIRERGYAHAEEENEPGLASVSLPVRDHRDAVVAAVTLAGARERFNDTTVREMVMTMRQIVNEFEQRLGRAAAQGGRS